jgi:hypothetical protein|tara:strand:+ start:4189 stop:4386 length:198 start_codon:yes stop_codon:yes gene_type:complete
VGFTTLQCELQALAAYRTQVADGLCHVFPQQLLLAALAGRRWVEDLGSGATTCRLDPPFLMGDPI